MLIPLPLMWVVWKERNTRVFNGIENNFNIIKDRWFYTFSFLFLGHDIKDLENFGMVLDHLIEL